MNKIQLTGNLVRNIDLHEEGNKYIQNAIAVKRNFKNKNGEYESDFFNITMFGHNAEYIAKYGAKGCKVAISGRLQSNTYQNKDGENRTSITVIADEVELLTYPKNDTEEKLKDFGDAVVISGDNDLLY